MMANKKIAPTFTALHSFLGGAAAAAPDERERPFFPRGVCALRLRRRGRGRGEKRACQKEAARVGEYARPRLLRLAVVCGELS